MKKAKGFRVAFGSVPKDGGTFTFYRNIRESLLSYGIEIICVSIGRVEAGLWNDAYADDNCVLLVPNTRSVEKHAKAFVEFCIAEHIDMVMAINSIAILSSLPHLPKRIRVVARCANAFDHGYRITMSGRQRLYRIVCLAPIQLVDLVNSHGAERKLLELIPNGTDPDRFQEAALNRRGQKEALQLVFMGRLEHKQKGVLYIPEVLSELERLAVPYQISIAGEGVHERHLKKQLATQVATGSAVFVGVLKPDQVPSFLADADIFLFPSHFEGSPNALIEAIMAGCVPAAWDIEGLIDFVVKNGETGVLAPVGDTECLAQGIARLHRHRDLLVQYSQAARSDAIERFSVERMAMQYRRVFESVMTQTLIPCDPLPWDKFRVDPAFAQPWWKKAIPFWVKDVLRPFKQWMMAHRSI